MLDHHARKFFERPFVHWLGGRSLREATAHFFAMRAVFPGLRAVCLLDGDNRDEANEETTRAGLVVLRWRRYEIENYLLQPCAIERFASMGFPPSGPLLKTEVYEEFWQQVPRGTDLFGDHVALVRVKASNEFLVPLFERLARPTPKKDLYLLAAAMRDDELHPEVIEKLDRIAEGLGLASGTPGA